MALHAREALNRLIAALEHHLDVAEKSDAVQTPVLERSEDAVRDAFFTYDDALFTNYGLELPFEILDDDFDGDEDDEDDDFDSGAPGALIDDDDIELVDISTDEEITFD